MVGDLDLALRIRADTRRAATQIRSLRGDVDRLNTSVHPRGSQRARQLGQAWQTVGTRMAAVRRAATGLHAAIAGAAAVGAVVAIARVGVEFDRLERRMRFAAGSAEAGRREMEFVRAEAERLGLDLLAAADGYSAFAAASRGTALEGQTTRDIFTAVAEAAAVMGLSADDARGVFTALEQIVSKGTVSAEELRGQLGERLPGAFQIAARSIGVSTDELDEMLRKGELAATELLPALARQIRREFGGEVETAADAADASFRRFNNAVRDIANDIYASGLRDVLKDLAEYATSLLNSVAELIGLRPSPDERTEGFARGQGELTPDDLRRDPRLAEAARVQEQALRSTAGQRQSEIDGLEAAIAALDAQIAERVAASAEAEAAADEGAANRAALDAITMGVEEGIRRAQADGDAAAEREAQNALQRELEQLREDLALQRRAIEEETAAADRLAGLIGANEALQRPALSGPPQRGALVERPDEEAAGVDPKAADRAAKEIERIRAQAEERIARLVLDRIEQVNRAERQSLDRVLELLDAGLVSAADAEAARSAIVRAAAAERSKIRQEELDRLQEELKEAMEEVAEQERERHELMLGFLEREHEALVASLEDQQRRREEAVRAHADAVASIEANEVDLGLVSQYEAGRAAAQQWRDETLAALDAVGEGHEEMRQRVERVYQAMVVAANDAAEEQEAASESLTGGIEAGLRSLAEDSESLGEAAQRATIGAFRSMEDALVNFVRNGKLEFADLADAIISDLARIAIQQAITIPLAGALFGAFGTPVSPAGGAAPAVPSGVSLFGGVAHRGGIAGGPGARRLVSPRLFAGARRYHQGGLLGRDEVPIIARRGEGIFTPEQMRALGPPAPPRIDINFVNQGTPQRETGRRIEINPEGMMVTLFTEDVGRGGQMAKSLESTYGLRRVAP